MEDKYTPSGLPKVISSTLLIGTRDDSGSLGKGTYDYQLFYSEIRKILENEDPNMLKYLDVLRKSACNKFIEEGLTIGFAQAYKMLRRQSEINQLEEHSHQP